jgi:hypothetical protein
MTGGATSENAIRHCEERSDEAIQSFSAEQFLSIVRLPAAHEDWIASLSLAMTGGATGENAIRHCEERSDEAIQSSAADHFLSIVRLPAAHKDWIASLRSQ